MKLQARECKLGGEGDTYKLNSPEPPNVFKIFNVIVNNLEIQYIAHKKIWVFSLPWIM